MRLQPTSISEHYGVLQFIVFALFLIIPCLVGSYTINNGFSERITTSKVSIKFNDALQIRVPSVNSVRK